MVSMKDAHMCKCGHAGIEHARVSPRVCIHEKGGGDYCPCDAFFPVKKIVRCKCGHGVGAHTIDSASGGCRACCCGRGQVSARESALFVAPSGGQLAHDLAVDPKGAVDRLRGAKRKRPTPTTHTDVNGRELKAGDHVRIGTGLYTNVSELQPDGLVKVYTGLGEFRLLPSSALQYVPVASRPFDPPVPKPASGPMLGEASPVPKDLRDASPWTIEGEAIGDLVAEKNAAYGDSFARSGRVLRELYPNGISLEQLDDALTIVRVLDKLFRIATDKDAFGEDPWKDIVGYGLLSVVRRGARKADS